MRTHLKKATLEFGFCVTKLGADLNDKIFAQIALLQSIAFRVIPQYEPTYREDTRYTLKNHMKILYATVLEVLSIQDRYLQLKISK